MGPINPFTKTNSNSNLTNSNSNFSDYRLVTTTNVYARAHYKGSRDN